MNNRSIAWWLKQIGLPQYTKTLESEYYGLEVRHMCVFLFCASVAMLLVSRQVRSKKDIFRHSVLPRLQRAVSNDVSASCSQLHPLTEDQRTEDAELSQETVLPQLFGGRREMDALKKELEEELKTSTEDLRSHAWYHGPVSREGAEALLERDGDFLVRDSSSGPGDYVLSCYWRDEPMHFKIIRVVLRPKKGYSRELFQFEEDRFDNVPALVLFYVGGRRPISQASGAIVFHPITRTLPIRVISERQAERAGGSGARTPLDRCKRRSLSYAAADMLHLNNPLLRSGSQPANLQNLGRRPSMQSAQSDSNLRNGIPFYSHSPHVLVTLSISLFLCGGVTLRGSDGQLHPRAPPKPLRVSVVFPNAVLPSSYVAHDDPSSFYDELVVQVPPPKNKKGHVDRLRAEEKWQSRARLTETSFSILEPQDEGAASHSHQNHGTDGVEDWHFERPNVDPGSCFQLDRFESTLLPENNRPLEPSVLLALKELFVRADARTTSLHMLSVDCQVARIAGVSDEQQRRMGVESGLELVTLPHGHQLRQDLLERHHLIALGVAVDVLGCTGSVGQRAAVLHKVISLAQALKEHAHNLYSFSAVMKALEMPQVVRLEMTWRALRRSFTESAVLFEKKLKPFMKSLSEGDDTVVQGPVAVPHLVPLLMAMEGQDPGEDSERGCQLLYDMLQAARNAALNAPVYQRHAHSLLTAGDWEAVPELLEAFRTEFALRLFWGAAGAEAERQERYDKFDTILGVLSDKLEPEEMTPVQHH
uniref:Breast cancer anti-estrogen resistance protein 3 n=1 Tax=Gadus morhua TaxID=8049 RepID=A0A8C4Z8X2_GADMO